MAIKHPLPCLFVISTILLAGCATNPGEKVSCNNPGTKSAARYLPLEPVHDKNYPSLPAGVAAATRAYTLKVNTAQLRPCGTLVMQKDVFLQRSNDPTLVLKEIREFYAQDGTLIAKQSEDVTAQLPNTGMYRGSLTLPIPALAPAGRYHIVSKLVLQKKNKKIPVVLGWADTSFQIMNQD